MVYIYSFGIHRPGSGWHLTAVTSSRKRITGHTAVKWPLRYGRRRQPTDGSVGWLLCCWTPPWVMLDTAGHLRGSCWTLTYSVRRSCRTLPYTVWLLPVVRRTTAVNPYRLAQTGAKPGYSHLNIPNGQELAVRGTGQHGQSGYVWVHPASHPVVPLRSVVRRRTSPCGVLYLDLRAVYVLRDIANW